MLSESQERMLLIVTPDKVDIVKSIGARWGLNVAEIGVVTGSGNLEVMENGIKVAEVPARLLTEAPAVSYTHLDVYKRQQLIYGIIQVCIAVDLQGEIKSTCQDWQ